MLSFPFQQAGFGKSFEGSSPHRYWRLNITDNNGSASNTAVNELELRIVIGGSSVATGGTASASSVLSSYVAAYAFDNAANFWVSTSKVCWLMYDFGASNAKDIIQFAIRSRPDGFQGDTPKDFQLQYSDDNSTWITSKSVTGATAWANDEIRVYS